MSIILSMGKYAAFIWPAYGLSALAIIAAVALTLRAYYRAKVRLSGIGRNIE